MPKIAGKLAREKIMQAALRLIAQGGVDAITHRRVGAEAGVSHGVVSYHYPARTEIILAAFTYHMGAVTDYSAQSTMKEGDIQGAEELADYLTRLVDSDLNEQHAILIETEMAAFATRNEELAILYRQWFGEAQDRLTGTMERLKPGSGALLAGLLVNLVQGFELETLTRPELTAEDFRARLQHLLPSLLID